MPIYNITIDDSSPFISYGSAWNDTPSGDAHASLYLNHTWHDASELGSVANFTFNGTGVYLYGAMRTNHGQYSVSIDDHVTQSNGYASPDVFGALLYGNGSLSYGEHRVSLSTTQAGSFVDLDYITITTGDGNANSTSEDIVFDDNTAVFQYYGSGWKTDIGFRQSTYSNSTVHVTSVPNDAVQVHFNGNAISVFGATVLQHGPFSASIDGAPAILLSGLAPGYRPQQLLYRYDGLPDGDHTLTLVNLGANSSISLGLDFAVVTRYSNTTTETPGSASSLQPSPKPSDGSISLNPGTLAGIVVGAVLASAALLGLGLWLVRRRRNVPYKLVDRDITEAHAFPLNTSLTVAPRDPSARQIRTGATIDQLGEPPSYVAVEEAPSRFEQEAFPAATHNLRPGHITNPMTAVFLPGSPRRDRKLRPPS